MRLSKESDLSHLHLNHPAPRPKLRAHLGHAFFGLVGFHGVADVLADLHAAEFGAAHGAEVGGLVGLFREGLVVVFAGGFGVEAEVELVFPAELEPRA